MSRLNILLCAIALVCVVSPASAAPRKESLRTTSTLPLPVKLEDLPAETREALNGVMKSPTITAICPAEEFVAHADTYKWLLDHPDRTAAAWRKLGVEAVEIKMMKDGRFCWKDENGSELVWQNVASGPNGRIWFAEGKVKAGLLLPTVPVKAVAVLNHSDKQRATGDSLITHQIEIYLHTSSRAASLATKILGDSVPKMAEQGSEQLLMFFSGIAKYAHNKPEKAKALLSESEK